MGTDRNEESDEGLTYAAAGVDIEASESATAALLSQIDGGTVEGYAGILDIGDRYLGLTTDGVGTKILVAEALSNYSTIGIDCIAMNVNDLVAAGIEPIAFVDYLAVETPDESIAEQIGAGLNEGARRANIHLVGGETAVMPDVISGLDLAGAAVGVADHGELFDGAAEPGDVLVGFPSTGIHSNGLTLARRAVTRSHAYTDVGPGPGDRTIGELLLEPTAIYTDLLEPMQAANVRAAAHITGGGLTNLERLGNYRYHVSDPLEPQPIFDIVQRAGDIDKREMYRTFNMGTGFVAAVDPNDSDRLVDATDGRVIGSVEEGRGIFVDGVSVIDEDGEPS